MLYLVTVSNATPSIQLDGLIDVLCEHQYKLVIEADRDYRRAIILFSGLLRVNKAKWTLFFWYHTQLGDLIDLPLPSDSTILTCCIDCRNKIKRSTKTPR